MQMIDKIGVAAMLEQLAEEASELSHAALKAARALRGENPTPVSYADAIEHLNEEYTDVRSCATELGLVYNEELEAIKVARFFDRWEKMTGGVERE